ncbi:MAG: lipopolysaccharide heptosyltransferase II [Acidobacteria bacterium]|nr:lipopolysaccharide heptosyltransferase II [Acidobacteriota bacterium]
MTEASRLPERIVVRVPNWLGDAVMALPALVGVRAAFPDASLTVAAPPSIAPMFAENTGVGQQEVLTVERGDEANRLCDGRFDTILLLPNSFRTAWTARQSGIPERWGYAAGVRGPLLTRPVKRSRTAVHQATFYADLVRALGIPASDAAPRIIPSDRTQKRAAALLEPACTVGFAPGAAYGHAKRWPPDRVAQVVTRLVRERGARCVLVGSEGDREAGRAIESSLPPDVTVTNLIGRTDLRLLIGVLARCTAFVSNDSGAMHLAAAAGIPVTAIFGPTNEKATAPIGDHDVLIREVFCRPCLLRECPIDHRCMTRISAEDVYASVVRRL